MKNINLLKKIAKNMPKISIYGVFFVILHRFWQEMVNIAILNIVITI